MTIYTDAIGNKFLGDCIWANHDINYPTTKFLQAHPHASIAQELADLYTASGKSFTGIANQSVFNALSNNVDNPCSLGSWKNANDSTATQYRFRQQVNNWKASVSSQTGAYNFSGGDTYLFGNTGGTIAYSQMTAGISGYGLLLNQNGTIYSPIYWAGVADDLSVAMSVWQYNFTGNAVRGAFWYSGQLADINTNFNYYNANYFNSCIVLLFSNTYSIRYSRHYIANTSKFLLETGDAQYPIVCADGQNPTSQWATDMYVFDNNATLGYPAIGRVRNLLLAQGTYTIGKPVKIQGSAMPDAGFNRWIPVGTFSGKTVLMRCYSSVDI